MFNPSFLLELTFQREREREREQKCPAYAKSILANVLQRKLCVLLKLMVMIILRNNLVIILIL